MKPVVSKLLDGSAMSLSGLCMVHCLVLPVLIAFLPVLGPLAHAEWIHILFVGMAAPVAAIALLKREHGRFAPLGLILLGGLGVGLLALGAFGSEAWETPVTVAGSLSLASAHLWNWRRHANCPVVADEAHVDCA